MLGYERRKKKVFRRCLSDGAEVISDGSSFHKSAPTTGNDRLPMVLRRMNGVASFLQVVENLYCIVGFMDVSPLCQFAPWTFCPWTFCHLDGSPQDVSSPGRFATLQWTIRP